MTASTAARDASSTADQPDDGEALAQALSRFPRLVVVANNGDLSFPDLVTAYGSDALYVLFNKAYRMADKGAGRNILLVARTTPDGPRLLDRPEKLRRIEALFAADKLAGYVILRALENEVFGAARYGEAPHFRLDCVADWRRFCPPGHMLSTGFAFVLWAARRRLPCEIVLAGFTGTRSEHFSVFPAHEWTWEQTVLRALTSAGYIRQHADSRPGQWPLAAVAAEFPGISVDQLRQTSVEMLSQRLTRTLMSIDTLYAATRIPRFIRRLLRRLRGLS